MTKRNRNIPFSILLLGAGLLLVTISAWYFLDRDPLQTDLTAVPSEVNYPAPELTLTDLNGATRSLADYRGTVLLVNLWTTWCPPCKEEMPALQAFHNKYKDDGFSVIAINDGETKPEVIAFVDEYQLTFPVWLDPTYLATEQTFRTLNLPSSYVIDREGTIRLRWVGGVTRKTLENDVAPLIKEEQ